METLLEMLEEVQDGIDYKTETQLVTNKLLDSLSLVALVSSIEDEYGVVIGMEDFIPENFDSVNAMWNLITRLKEEN